MWKWRRRLLAWEEELVGECRLLLRSVFLQGDIQDCCIWIPDPIDGYVVCSAYCLLTSEVPHHFTVVSDRTAYKDFPLEVSLFAWRLLRNRLSTKDNLFCRGIIPKNSQVCITGCGNVESTSHMFLGCEFFLLYGI